MKRALAIDVGGTKIYSALVNVNGEIISDVEKTPTPKNYDDIISTFKSIISKHENEVDVIAFSTCGAVNNENTRILGSTGNIAGQYPATNFLELSKKPVFLENDANCAAWAEYKIGASKDCRHSIMLTLGTGVGSGIVINGDVVYGHDGFAGELGHTCAVRNNGRLCNCGKYGCLEAYTSAVGVARTAREWLDMSDEPSLLRSLPEITSKDVYEAAVQGDKLSIRIFEYTGRMLGRSFADFVAFSAPEAIILFGGLARAGELLIRPIREEMNANLLSYWKNKVAIIQSALKESDAAILGASALAW